MFSLRKSRSVLQPIKRFGFPERLNNPQILSFMITPTFRQFFSEPKIEGVLRELSNALEKANKESAELTKKTNLAQIEVNNLSSEIWKSRDIIETSKNVVETLDPTIKSMDTTVTKLKETDVPALQQKVKELAENVQGVSEEIPGLQDKVTTLENDKNDFQQGLKNIEENTLPDIKRNVSDIFRNLDGCIISFISKIQENKLDADTIYFGTCNNNSEIIYKTSLIPEGETLAIDQNFTQENWDQLREAIFKEKIDIIDEAFKEVILTTIAKKGHINFGLKSKIKEINAHTSELKEEAKKLSEKIRDSLEPSIAELASTAGTLQGDIASLKTSIPPIEFSISGINESLKNFQEKTNKLEGDLNPLGEKISGFEERVSNMDKELESLKKLVESSEEKIKKILKDEVENLSQKIKDSEGRIRDLWYSSLASFVILFFIVLLYHYSDVKNKVKNLVTDIQDGAKKTKEAENRMKVIGVAVTKTGEEIAKIEKFMEEQFGAAKKKEIEVQFMQAIDTEMLRLQGKRDTSYPIFGIFSKASYHDEKIKALRRVKDQFQVLGVFQISNILDLAYRYGGDAPRYAEDEDITFVNMWQSILESRSELASLENTTPKM